MCAVAAKFSPVVEVRSLERSFIDVTKRQIDLAVRDDDKGLLQVLQASSLLAYLHCESFPSFQVPSALDVPSMGLSRPSAFPPSSRRFPDSRGAYAE